MPFSLFSVHLTPHCRTHNMASVEDSNVIKTAAAKPFFYRDLAVKKLQDNPNSTVVISGLGSGTTI